MGSSSRAEPPSISRSMTTWRPSSISSRARTNASRGALPEGRGRGWSILPRAARDRRLGALEHVAGHGAETARSSGATPTPWRRGPRSKPTVKRSRGRRVGVDRPRSPARAGPRPRGERPSPSWERASAVRGGALHHRLGRGLRRLRSTLDPVEAAGSRDALEGVLPELVDDPAGERGPALEGLGREVMDRPSSVAGKGSGCRTRTGRRGWLAAPAPGQSQADALGGSATLPTRDGPGANSEPVSGP